MADNNKIQTELARAKGLGSAHSGLHHWWTQRLTAIALVPLSVWLFTSLIMLIGRPYELFKMWASTPWITVLLFITIFTIFYHAYLGVQVVIEDYLSKGRQLFVMLLVKAVIVLCGTLSLFSILKIALT